MAGGNNSSYRAQEVCEKLNISKKTLFKWEAERLFPAIERDWHNWRVYSEEDIQNIRKVKEEKARELRDFHERGRAGAGS